jgi:hypothetical protein
MRTRINIDIDVVSSLQYIGELSGDAQMLCRIVLRFICGGHVVCARSFTRANTFTRESYRAECLLTHHVVLSELRQL